MNIDPALIASRTRVAPVCEARDGSRFCKRLAVSAVVADPGRASPLDRLESRCDRHASPDAPRFCTSCHGPNDLSGFTCHRCAERSDWQPPRTTDRRPR